MFLGLHFYGRVIGRGHQVDFTTEGADAHHPVVRVVNELLHTILLVLLELVVHIIQNVLQV